MKKQRSRREEIQREERWADMRYKADRRRVDAIQRRVEVQERRNERDDARFFNSADTLEGEYDIYINGIQQEPEEHARAVERAATGRKGREQART